MGSIVATADQNALLLQTPGAFTLRLGDIAWDTSGGPLALGVADGTQGQAGLVTMPTWQESRNGPDEWCGSTVALDLTTIQVPAPPPQGGPPLVVPRFTDVQRPTGISRPTAGIGRPVVPH